MKKFARIFAAALLLTAGTQQAHAQLVNFTLTGVVDYAQDNDWWYGPNPFGLQSGDQVVATATFDDSLINPYGYTLIDFSDPWLGIDMNIQVGSTHYSNDDEVFGGPWLHLYNGVFDGLDYSSTDWEFDAFGSNFDGWEFDGHWQCAEISPVPLPAAAWLMISGLLGFSVFPCRKQK